MNSEAGQNNNQISSNQPVIETLDLNPTQQPVASTVQTQPAASVTPVAPAQPVAPVTSVQPVAPTVPTQFTTPVTPVVPIESVVPAVEPAQSVVSTPEVVSAQTSETPLPIIIDATLFSALLNDIPKITIIIIVVMQFLIIFCPITGIFQIKLIMETNIVPKIFRISPSKWIPFKNPVEKA